MAVTGGLRFGGRLLGAATGPVDVDLAWEITAGTLYQVVLTLSTSETTLTFPNTTKLIVLKPPTGNATAWGVRAATGIARLNLHLTDPTVLAIALGATTLILQADASIAGFEARAF